MTMRQIGPGGRVALALGAAAVAAALGLFGLGPMRAWWYERAMRSTPRPVDVLLITLDTTRADRLGAYGWNAAETPHLDALAARGTLFRQAYAHVPLTAPSHASLFTGLLPTRHGVRDNGTYVLDSRFPVVAERFRSAGYATAAMVSAFVLDRRFGLGRGFETYDDRLPGSDADRSGDPSERSIRAAATIDRAIAWLKRADSRPRFLWVHLYDPHFPYDAPEPFAGRHRDRPYDGEIAYMDAQIGRLLEAAAGERPWLRVVTADHGEGLGDHEELTHGYFVYRETQRVPLIVSLPGRVPSGRAIEDVVRGVDIAPTILELSGLPPLTEIDGRSLVPLLAGRGGDPRPAYLESFHPRIWWGAQELLALRTGKWLYIEAPRPELYDVDADPAERTNLAGSQPDVREVLRLQLRTYATPGAPLGAQIRPDAEAASRLRSLGYLGAGAPDPAGAGRDLPDPKDNGPLLAAVSQGQELKVQGRLEEALGRFREALAKNPRSLSVRLSVAELLLGLGRHEEAFTAYGDIAATGAALESAYLGMMRTRVAQGDVVAALQVSDAGLERVATSGDLHAERGDLLMRLGRMPDAEEAYRRAVAIAPENEKARWGLGVVLSKQGRRQESVEMMLALVERSPLSPQARAAARALNAWADERMEARAPADARRGYQAALDAGQMSEELFLNLALALWQVGERRESLRILEQGAARYHDSVELAYRHGRVLQQLGRRDEAAAAFQRALQLDPHHAGAAAAIAGR